MDLLLIKISILKDNPMSDIDRMTFQELCNKAGFVKETKIDIAALAKFYGKSERTMYRMIATGMYHPMNIKMLKMHVLNIELKDRLQVLTESEKFPVITRLIEDLDESKINKILGYSDIKKRAIKIALKVMIFLYRKIS